MMRAEEQGAERAGGEQAMEAGLPIPGGPLVDALVNLAKHVGLPQAHARLTQEMIDLALPPHGGQAAEAGRVVPLPHAHARGAEWDVAATKSGDRRR